MGSSGQASQLTVRVPRPVGAGEAQYRSAVSGRGRVVAIVAVWTTTGLAAILLSVQRFREAAFQHQPDFGGFFLPAAQAIVSSQSPYSVEGYYYSPLVALLIAPFAETSVALAAWTAMRILAGLIACGLIALACVPRGSWLRAGIIALGAVVTLFWSWPTTLDLWAGQVQLLVLLALGVTAFAHTRGRRLIAGIALGMAAVVKTWPALIIIWLLRRGSRGRLREWLGVLIAAAFAVVLALIAGGPQGVVAMLASPLAGRDQPLLAANSVWGVPRLLFAPTPVAEPAFVSPGLQLATTILLAVLVVGLGVVILMRPGPAVVALFNVTLVVILLLPVSHYFYVICALPLLWFWAGHALENPRSPLGWVVFGVLAVWWVVVFRIPPDGDGFMTTTWPSLLRIFGASLIAAIVSVVAAAVLDKAGGGVLAGLSYDGARVRLRRDELHQSGSDGASAPPPAA